jgi:hypothetical protein
VTPYGLPVAGDVWTITLDNDASEVLGGETEYSYTVAMGDTPFSVAQALALEISTFGAPEYVASADGNVITIVSRAGNAFTVGVAIARAAGSSAFHVLEQASATVETRVDGINYYGFKTLNIQLGAGDDVFNVRGTSARTNLDLGNGDERVYVSSDAAFDAYTHTNFLTGHLTTCAACSTSMPAPVATLLMVRRRPPPSATATSLSPTSRRARRRGRSRSTR